MVEYGMPAIEVIRAATISGAEILGLDSMGEIAVSKEADILIVDGDPISDMAAMENVKAV